MKPNQQSWERLAAAARRVPEDDRDTAAPHGFATRVAALAMSAEPAMGSLFERFSWRALGVAGLIALACVAADYSAFTSGSADDEPLPDDTAVATLLDFTS